MESLSVFRDDHDTGGILVQSMNDPWASLPPYPLEIRTVMEDGVDQSAPGTSRSRMDDHPRGFIHHDEIFVFVQDLERERLGHQRCLPRRKPLNLDQVAGLESNAGLRPSAIKPHLSGDDHLLDT
jgi:hypothetical protein